MSDTLTPDELATLERTALARVDAGLAGQRHTYAGHGGAMEAVCDLHVFVIKPDRMAAVVLTERQDNLGRSVTNAIEQLADEIYGKYLADAVPPGRVAWVQHDELMTSNTRGYERVRLEWAAEGESVRFHSPAWMTLRPSALAAGGAA